MLTGKLGPNTRYCEFCKVQVRKEREKKRLRGIRANRDVDELREQNRKYIQDYRERWGWSNKNEQLGSGRLSPKRNEDFEVEKKIIQWEKRRLGIV